AFEQPRVLQHHAHVRTQVGAAEIPGVEAVEDDGAAGDLVEAHHEVDQGGLAGSGRADDRDRMAGVGSEGHLLDERSLRGVAEADLGEFDLSGGAGRKGAVRLIRVLFLRIEDRKSTRLNSSHDSTSYAVLSWRNKMPDHTLSS